MLSNAYGRFIEGGAAYEITDPQAPSPWSNVISNGRYGLVVSHNGGGFSFLDHCQLNVITRWDMDLIRDDSGRFVFLRDLDEETSETWSLSPQPCGTTHDSYRCVHRAGMTSFETTHRGIRATWEIAVTPEDTAEVWCVTLENISDRGRRLRLGSYLEWCCGAAPDVKREFHKLFFTTAYDEDQGAIVATKNMWEAPFGDADDHWNRPWPHAASFAIGGVDTHWATADKAAFLGRYGSKGDPAGMRDGVGSGRFGRFIDPCAAIGSDLALGAGESKTVWFVLAVDATPEAVRGLVNTYMDRSRVDGAFEQATASWRSLLAPTRAATEMEDLDLLVNHWLPYQAISARMWARTGYYQQSGAFGFRDQLQDSQLWLLYDPARCREQILLHAAHQFADGSVYHWWNPLTETGLHDACSDDYLWLPYVTAAYVRETGDVSILDERRRFVDDEAEASLAEHCLRSIRRSMSRRTARGLPLIGANDWNDGLSHVGDDTRGESVWLAFFVCDVLGEFADAIERRGDIEVAVELRAMKQEMRLAVNEHGWDGAWFRRATDRDGRWLGSAGSAEGQLFLNPQTWAILGETTSEDRAASAWGAVRDRLVQDYGVLLLEPAYTVPDPKIGYLSRYAPGSRENGGVYMHAATWALAAACKRRDVEMVERIWRGVSPPLRARDADAYAAEPYVTPGNVDGPLSDTPGRAGWTWYTGSAAWLHRIAVEWVLGVRATWEGLRIDPCPFAGLGEVDVTRTWRGRRVRVRYDARAYEPRARVRLDVNGVAVEGGVLDERALDDAGTNGHGEIEVRVTWGGPPAPKITITTAERSRA